MFLTPRRLTSRPPCGPGFAVCGDIGDKGDVLITVESHPYPRADLSWPGLNWETTRVLGYH
jgi:hypothetical protein